MAKFWCWALAVMLAAGGLCRGEEKIVYLTKGEESNNFGWTTNDGREFPGAVVSLSVDNSEGAALKLVGDFTKGGNYVSAGYTVKQPRIEAGVLSFDLKWPGRDMIAVRLIDESGQCHQIRIKLDKSDGWQKVSFNVKSFLEGKERSPEAAKAGRYENWGGKKDARWHGALNSVHIINGKPAGENSNVVSTMLLRNVEISGEVVAPPASAGKPGSFAEDFDKAAALPAGWQAEGDVTIDASGGFKKSKHALRLARTEETIHTATHAKGPAFPVIEGIWQVKGAFKSALYSPDLSFNGAVLLELLDKDGKSIGSREVVIITKDNAWGEFSKNLILPAEAARARLNVVMNKSFGDFSIDALVATYVGPAPKSAFSAIKIAPRAYGSLFLPGDKVGFDITVECAQELPADKRTLAVAVTDYWGAEISDPLTLPLGNPQTTKTGVNYTAALDLGGYEFAQGKYHEVRVLADAGEGDSKSEVQTFAILPIAVTKNYEPHEIPFTINNWDDRIKDTFFLTDRVGIRWKLVWSGWEEKPPYKPYAPGIEWIKELGMGAVLGMRQVSNVEQGKVEPDPVMIREGAKNLVNAYKDYVPIMIRCGNDPHGGPEQIKKYMVAYKAAYEGAKEAWPEVFYIGTSCNPQEEYFRQGLQHYADAVDFHTYEGWKDTRKIFTKYHEIFKKYGFEQPIFTTETGLNSQGMSRQEVARVMVKKFSVFFAEGGANFSWFNMMYPDPKGVNVGSNGESFDVFNSKYNLFSPKLTAVMYYNLVNGICIKKFVEEKEYGTDKHAMLFRDRDNRCLITLWKEKGREDAFLPLPGVKEVRVIRIDGSDTVLSAGGKGLTLTFSEDPLLLLFDSADLKLTESPTTPAAALKGALPEIVLGAQGKLPFTLEATTADNLELVVPFGWKSEQPTSADKEAVFGVSAPRDTKATLGMLYLRFKDGSGELSLPLNLVGKLALRLIPEPYTGEQAGIRVRISNNSDAAEEVSYNITMPREIAMASGTFKKSDAQPFAPQSSKPAEGKVTVAGNSHTDIVLPVSNLNAKNIYRARATASDSTGESAQAERYLSGFVGVPKVKPLTFDLAQDEAAWGKARILDIDEERQYFAMKKQDGKTWSGKDDLSGKLRFLWDEKYLYLRMDVTDDRFVNGKSDGSMWAMDGLQLLVDPLRAGDVKCGYYDIALGDGAKGPQAWVHSSADSTVPTGEARGIIVKSFPGAQNGDRIYIAALPWGMLAPFTPGAGSNLGIAVIMNEDDGEGRTSFMGWFGCAHSKQLDFVGDLLLQE